MFFLFHNMEEKKPVVLGSEYLLFLTALFPFSDSCSS